MKSKMIILGLVSLLLIGSLLATGCVPSATTTTGSTGTATGGFDWTIILFLVVIFGLMYFLMIRPQRNRQKQQQRLLEELKRGDEIITNAGIYGIIESVEETSYVIKLEGGSTMRILRNVVAGKKPENPLT